MATLESLQSALRQAVEAYETTPLSDAEYSAGFEIFQHGSGWSNYENFIIPRLSELLRSILYSRAHISVLEIGPGPKSVLEHLPNPLRYKITTYTAFEPNALFAAKLEQNLWSSEGPTASLPSLEKQPKIHRQIFHFGSTTPSESASADKKFDVVLFCHSMYGTRSKRKVVERALDMLVPKPKDGLVVVFHRQVPLQLNGLMCHQTASFPTGSITVADEDKSLDCFASLIGGFSAQHETEADQFRRVWRQECRRLGRRVGPGILLFQAPEVMVAFSRHATALPELTARVPSLEGHQAVKNREARLYDATTIVRPADIRDVHMCVQWALEHKAGLTVIGGGHSGHCVWPYVVSIDMSAFRQVYVEAISDENSSEDVSVVVAGGGCKTGDIIREAMAKGFTVPLGSRPSVGAGIWLQGGIGHLTRLHGLACDAVVGAVVVSVESGQVLCVGQVPENHRPANSVRPKDENDQLWAIKGAGNNFGVVISVVFKAHAAPTYSVWNWVIPLRDNTDAHVRLRDFDEVIARKLDRDWSADAYLYWHNAQLHLGITLYGVTHSGLALDTPDLPIGPESKFESVDSVGLFETEMYMSGMHGGHGGGKTSAFKRCLFLKDITEADTAIKLTGALESRPTPLCYLHLLQGGGAIGDVTHEESAFGCRDWHFACVITGVWPRDQDGTETAVAAVEWVYHVVGTLLPVSMGVYGADLGPDPRDAELATRAFGENIMRLAHLKGRFDPQNVLAYACPLAKVPAEHSVQSVQSVQKLIVLVTGESCAGKDYCAEVWASILNTYPDMNLKAGVVSISEATKRDYAAATGADLGLLLGDRGYKERHRARLSAFFAGQVHQRPALPEEHFLDVVRSAKDLDVLFITGMREKAPVATLSHLVAGSRLIEVHVMASKVTRDGRRGCQSNGNHETETNGADNRVNGTSEPTNLDRRSCLIFRNEHKGDDAVKVFARQSLLPFFHEDIQQLASMVRLVPDFPSPGVEFRHVLEIAQQPGGLSLCTSLLMSHFTGDWAQVDVVVCCEAGGYVFAAPLASRVDTPLVLIREAGKLPPPTVSISKRPSHVSSFSGQGQKRMEMNRDVLPKGAKIMVIDDVLATGTTLCGVLELLAKAGVNAEQVTIMVVAEFPLHRGRDLLRRAFGEEVHVQSLLVFDGY